MSIRAFTVGLAAVVCAVPAAAQQRGTVEFGAFGSAGVFDKSLTLNSGIGGGGRVGAYLDPRWALEFDKGEMRATRTLGLKDVNVGILAARLVATPIKSGALSIMLGAGAGSSTETNFLHSYGINGLIGAKIALSNTVALRADLISDWLANNDWKSYQTLHVGMSFYRNPTQTVRTVEVPVAGPPCPVCAPPPPPAPAPAPPPPPAPAPPKPREIFKLEGVHFEFDKSTLTTLAKGNLGAAVTYLKANPNTRVEIQAHTDSKGSDAYNQALSERRAASVLAFLKANGIEAERMSTKGFGESQPVADNATDEGRALNRRAVIIELP
jgi:outer membrane protein OmpA-like peptidoglycan-associated protein